MPQTETIHTEYGEVEAETETCHKCGEKKLAENTMDIVMGKRIRSWSSGSAGGRSYPAHTGVSGLDEERHPEHQVWCLECAEYELGYAVPAGRDGRNFPSTTESLKVKAFEHRGSIATVLSAALTAGFILL